MAEIKIKKRSMDIRRLAIDAGMYEHCLFLDHLRLKGFSDDQIREVLLAMIGICRNCWNNPKGCKCWNDE